MFTTFSRQTTMDSDRTVHTPSSSYGSIEQPKLEPELEAATQTSKALNGEVLQSCLSDTKVITRRIYKNLAVLSITTMLVFAAQYCIYNLQSIIHPETGMLSLALIYVAKTISSFLLSSWLLKKITAKWSIILGIIGFSTFTVSHFYPRTYTLLPTAFLMGLTAAPLWAGIGSYIKKLGRCYASLTRADIEVVYSRMFGLFFACHQLSFALESIITASVLNGNSEPNETDSPVTLLDNCGISYCPYDGKYSNSSFPSSNATTPPPWEEVVVVFFAVLPLYAVGAVGIILFLDPIDSMGCSGQVNEGSSKTSSKEARCKFPSLLALTPDLVFIAPLPLWSGFLQGFIFSDYSKAFIDCGLGINMLGPVMAVFGVVATIGALVIGPLVQRVGQTPVTAAGGVSCAFLISLMFVWTSYPQLPVLLFVGSGLGGLADLVGQSQVRALYGSTFPDQSSESSSTLVFLESIGFFLNYIFQSTVCTLVKTTLLIALLALAMSGLGLRILWQRHRSSNLSLLH